MKKETSLRNWIDNYKKGKYSYGDVHIRIEAGWYDWFCEDDELSERLEELAPKVLQVAQSKRVNIDTMYVFFKNNCPCFGDLYDSFSICDIETGDVIFWVTPKSGHNGKAEVWGKDEEGKFGELVSGTWKEVENYFEIRK